MLSSCFTGVESTPTINSSELKKHIAPQKSAEESFLSDIVPTPVSRWENGKNFRITNSKISIIFNHSGSPEYLAEGKDLKYAGLRAAPSITGKGASSLLFINEHQDTLVYEVERPPSDLMNRERLVIPFTIETSIVDSVRARLVGKQLYITTSAWLPGEKYLPSNENIPSYTRYVRGLRHVPVEIVDVQSGNEAYPVCIFFKDTTGEFADRIFRIYMTVGSDHIATRNFDTLFNFDNPRKNYPRISNRIWNLIIHSTVEEGMTRDECRLALGTPSELQKGATPGTLVERWIYDNGQYLIFEDGVLTKFR